MAIGVLGSGCLAQGTEVSLSVTSMAPVPTPGATPSPDATAPSLPTGTRAPEVGRRLRPVDGVRAVAVAGKDTVVAREGRIDLLGRGGPARLVRVDGVPLDLVVPDPEESRAVVLLRTDEATVVRTLTWNKRATGRLGEAADAGDAVLLSADGDPVSVDASALAPSGVTTAAYTRDGDRVWAAVAGTGTIQVGVGTIVGATATMTPVTAWNTTEQPTTMLMTPEDAAGWVGTDAGTLWHLDVDGERAGNPVGYPLLDTSLDALLAPRGADFWATSGDRTVEVDPGTSDPEETAGSGA